MTMPSFPQMSLLQYVGASHVLGEYPAEPDLFGTDKRRANSGVRCTVAVSCCNRLAILTESNVPADVIVSVELWSARNCGFAQRVSGE